MNLLFEWLAMGGYSQYVWSAYSLACVLLLLNVLGIKRQKSRVFNRLRTWFKREAS